MSVVDNTFASNTADAFYGGKCTQANNCDQSGLFSVYSSTSAYPTYTVCDAISNLQNNVFDHNTYRGPWTFYYFNQGDTATPAEWQAGIRNVEGSGDNFGPQDVHSTFS